MNWTKSNHDVEISVQMFLINSGGHGSVKLFC